MPHPLPRIVAVVVLGIALAVPSGTVAQHRPQPHRVVDIGVAGANVLTGALTAAVTAAFRGESVKDAFFGGAVGGAAVFLGKRVVVEGFSGAGLAGRQVGSLGANIVANAGAGRAWLEEVWLPVGPLWLQASPSSRFGARLDLMSVGAAVWAVRRPELQLDWGRSLDSGALLFRAPRHDMVDEGGHIAGLAVAGVIAIAARPRARTQAHESVHVIQYDYMVHTISRPIERWGWQRLLGWEVPFDVSVMSLSGASRLVHELREAEAQVLERR